MYTNKWPIEASLPSALNPLEVAKILPKLIFPQSYVVHITLLAKCLSDLPEVWAEWEIKRTVKCSFYLFIVNPLRSLADTNSQYTLCFAQNAATTEHRKWTNRWQIKTTPNISYTVSHYYWHQTFWILPYSKFVSAPGQSVRRAI